MGLALPSFSRSATMLACAAVFALLGAGLSAAHISGDESAEDVALAAVFRQQGGSSCTTVRIPWNMCTACKLKPFTGTGPNLNFGGVNRYDIYDLSTAQCQAQLRRYAEYNPCDSTRTAAIASLGNSSSPNLALIYFMYSVCETCCDCVPIGARIEEYEQRRAAGSLINIRRGNCAAHFHYDTCNVWPNTGQITGLRGKQFDLAPWCPDFLDWINSPNSSRWPTNNNATGITFNMARAMRQLTNKARCKEESQWKNCVRMESAQGRL